MRPEDKYLHDPVFHNLVNLLGSFLEENAMRQWTPTELREAVMLAACRYEYVHVRPIVITLSKSVILDPPFAPINNKGSQEMSKTTFSESERKDLGE